MDLARTNRLSALAAALTLVAACGGGADSSSSSGGPTGGTGPDTAALFCDQLYTSFVDRLAACLKAPAAYVAHNIDKAKLCASPVAAVAAGKAVYDRGAAGRCLDAYANATCDGLTAVRDERIDLPDCRAAVTGTVAAGATCLSDSECASGRCNSNMIDGCGLTCSPSLPAGVRCSTNRNCEPGNFCYYGSVYPAPTCQPQANRPGEGQSCTGVDCAPGLYCTLSTGGVCKKFITSGACTTGKEMAPGYGCFSGVAKPYVAMGSQCITSFDCGPGAFCAYSVAAAANVCSQLPVVGQDCVQSRGAWECLGGICNVISLTQANCVEVTPDSMLYCATTWDCQSTGYCYGACKPWCVKP